MGAKCSQFACELLWNLWNTYHYISWSLEVVSTIATMSFECNHCSDRFTILQQYLKHIKDVHIENEETIQCNIGVCSEKNWTFTCKSTFGNHVYSHHKFATGTSKRVSLCWHQQVWYDTLYLLACSWPPSYLEGATDIIPAAKASIFRPPHMGQFCLQWL